MLVSIIIPTYNRSVLLKEAIQSVIAQTYRPIECIIVDDGSTDNTKEVVLEFQKRSDEKCIMKYISQPNSGSQVARNTGTAHASGEFIQYLDSDDLLYPDKIRSQVIYLNQHPQSDAVFGDWETGSKEKKVKVAACKNDDLITQMLTGRSIHTLAILMRRSLVNKIGDWDIGINRNQEIDFHLRGVLVGGRFEYEPCDCGLWRTHDDERIANSTGIPDILRAYQKWEQLLRKENLFDIGLQKKIAELYMWFLTQYEESPKSDLLMLLKEIIRLDPGIPFYNNKKLTLVRKLAGNDNALKLWLRRYYTIGDGKKRGTW